MRLVTPLARSVCIDRVCLPPEAICERLGDHTNRVEYRLRNWKGRKRSEDLNAKRLVVESVEEYSKAD